MTDKNFDEVPEDEGSDAAASGPAPQENAEPNLDSTEAAAAEGSDDDLTVDDILNAMQTEEAASEDGSDAGIADAESALLHG